MVKLPKNNKFMLNPIDSAASVKYIYTKASN